MGVLLPRFAQLLIIVILSFQNAAAVQVRFKVAPDVQHMVQSELNLTCSTSAADDGVVTKVTIERMGENPLATLDPKGVSLDLTRRENITAEGSLNDTSGQVNLRLTFNNPWIGDVGTYLCRIFYTHGDTALGETAVEADVNDVIKEVVKLTKKDSDLEGQVKSQQDKIKMMEEKASTVVAFHAFYEDGYAVITNKAVLFSDVVLNEGNAFNKWTGVFTVPRKGLYVFNLAITTYGSDLQIILDLVVKGKGMGRIHALSEEYWDQSSLSNVYALDAGDEVKAVPSYVTKTRASARRSSFFSGFLLKSL